MALPPWAANFTLASRYSPLVSSVVFKNVTRSPITGFSMTLSRSFPRIGFTFVRYNFGLLRWAWVFFCLPSRHRDMRGGIVRKTTPVLGLRAYSPECLEGLFPELRA